MMKLSSATSVIVAAFAGGALAWLQSHNAIPGEYGVIVGAAVAGLIAVVHLYQPVPGGE
jgi:hypothetical protein